jgi:hypothetical protein
LILGRGKGKIMITERQEQIENGIEVLDSAIGSILRARFIDCPPVELDPADRLAVRIMARLLAELQAEFNDVTVKNQNNS